VRFLCFLLPWALAAQTVSYDIRPAEGSHFTLEVFKSRLWEGRKHVFVFDRYGGELEFNSEQPQLSTVRFRIESASVRCLDDWVKPGQIADIEEAARETMAAGEHPEMTFESSTVTVKSPGEYQVQGTLTIRDIARPVTLQIAASAGGDVVRIAGTGQFLLSDFGLDPPRGAFSLFIGTKDAMNILFEIEAEASAE